MSLTDCGLTPRGPSGSGLRVPRGGGGASGRGVVRRGGPSGRRCVSRVGLRTAAANVRPLRPPSPLRSAPSAPAAAPAMTGSLFKGNFWVSPGGRPSPAPPRDPARRRAGGAEGPVLLLRGRTGADAQPTARSPVPECGPGAPSSPPTPPAARTPTTGAARAP